MSLADAIDDQTAGGLIAALLAEQDDLTAVERFAQAHADVEAPLQGRYYQALLPATPPGPGEQLGFEVDLDRCSGCKACVAACHALNGLDDEEAWRDVGLIVGGGPGLPVLQHVTMSCHHCLEPACLAACPVDAYEKDPITGIVRHLDDQCFGCQYCTLACPYDVPKYHRGKGIVRKCDLCADRLRDGEAPACVQSCPHEAIRVRVIDRAEVAARGRAGAFLPTAPDPAATLPTTRYLSTDPRLAAGHRADHHHDAPEHVHASLVFMLVLTQAAAGAFVADLLSRLAGAAGGSTSAVLLLLGFGLGQAGLAASLFHLGRPWFAYRALIGLRHSWLSREVAAFGAFAGLGSAHVAVAMLRPAWSAASLSLSALVASAGMAGVACSVMVYHATRRPFWRAGSGGRWFAGTSALLGAGVLLGAASWGGSTSLGSAAAAAMIVVAAIRLRADARVLAHRDDRDLTPLRRSAQLLDGPLRDISRLRRALTLVGGVVLPLCWLGIGPPAVPEVRVGVAVVAFVVATGGELAGRTLFFAAVVRPRMPGGLVS